MAHDDTSPLSRIVDRDLANCPHDDLVAEIVLFRRALRYCKDQQGDDNCWMDYRHMLMRFLPGYDPAKDDVTLDEHQWENCKSFIRCWQEDKDWECRGKDEGKTIPARSVGTLDCLGGSTPPKPFRWGFRVFRTIEGNVYLYGDYADHMPMLRAINDWIGKPVLQINGGGFNVCLKIVDLQAWSDYVSPHVEEDGFKDDIPVHFTFTMPDGPPAKKED